MGKTSKPLTILVHPDLAECPEITALTAKGHDIVERYRSAITGEDITQFDLILAPNAWRMDKDLLKYVDLAVTAARSKRYSKEKA